MLIKNGLVLHYDRIEAGCDLRVEKGQIVAVGQGLMAGLDEPTLDASGCYIVSGLIDLHNHGLRHVMA